MVEVRFSNLGEGIHEGILVKWEVAPLDRVREGQILFQLETEKINIEVPSPVSGVVVQLNYLKGERVFSGNILALIEDGVQP